MTRVLVLGGGPDAEREISVSSATGVHQGCLEAGLDAQLLIVDRPTQEDIQSWSCDVVFPVLHGSFGEGGALQSMLERAQVPFVGSKFEASRLAMDKLATKLIASRLGIVSPAACVLQPFSETEASVGTDCPFPWPVVVKPVADGSSVGLHICRDEAAWKKAIAAVQHDVAEHPGRVYMIERFAAGREITASVIADDSQPSELRALPLIEISPKQGVYDYEAKYTRNDTTYTVGPDLESHVVEGIQQHALELCRVLGVRHLARVDFLLSSDGHWVLLEANTMPGFTPTSLLPRAAQAVGYTMPQFCAHLVQTAIMDAREMKNQADRPVAQG